MSTSEFESDDEDVRSDLGHLEGTPTHVFAGETAIQGFPAYIIELRDGPCQSVGFVVLGQPGRDGSMFLECGIVSGLRAYCDVQVDPGHAEKVRWGGCVLQDVDEGLTGGRVCYVLLIIWGECGGGWLLLFCFRFDVLLPSRSLFPRVRRRRRRRGSQ